MASVTPDLRLPSQITLVPNLYCFVTIVVGAMNINDLMNINDVRESATIFPRPCKLTFDLLTLKVVSESRVTWATSVPILVFPGLSVLDFDPMYVTDRHTDVRQTTDRRQKASSLNAPAYGVRWGSGA